MAREQLSGGSDSGSARRTVAVLAVLLLSASVFAPASIAAGDGLGDRATVVAAAGNTDGDSVANDDSTTVANDDTTTLDSDDTAGNDEPVTISGHVTDGDGDPVANDTVRLERDGNLTDENRTDERGRYELRGERNHSYDLTYRQGDQNLSDRQANESARDGVPAVYAVGQVDASSNQTRNVSLPRASVLNVTVVAENGTSVSNATMRVTHVNGSANATVTGRTDEQGRLAVGGRVGVEVAGTVTVAVEAPNASLSDATATFSVENATEEQAETVILGLNDTDPPMLRYDVRPDPVNVSEPVTFDARDSTDESGIETTMWTIQDDIHEPEFDTSFSEPGTYAVELSATDWAGNENHTEVNITVVDERAPDPALAANATTVGTHESVRFNASNASDNHRIAEYRWDFDGDGVIDERTNNSTTTVTHAFAENGSYDATVVVVDPTGNRANASQQVTVREPPTADFSVTAAEPDINETVVFDATPSTGVANITNYAWTIEGDQTASDGLSFDTSFPENGTYDVTLTVTDERNLTDERTRTIEVANKPPSADAGENQSVIAGTEPTLDGSYSTDPDDDLSVRWNQTAGPPVTLSNTSAVEPRFTAPEVNETTLLRFELTVTDDQNATDQDSVTVTVAPQTKPDVSHDLTEPAVGELVTFEANRTGIYRWDFDGDGIFEATPESTNLTNATATHEFDVAGEYDVTLVDAAGRKVVHPVNVTHSNESSANDRDETSDDGNETTDGSDGDSGDSGGGAGGIGGGSGGGGSVGGTGGSGGTGGQSGSAADGDDGANDAATASESAADSDDGQIGESSSSVTVEQVQDGVRASVENASEDDPIAVQLPEEFAGNGSAFETVSVVSDAASNFSLSISPSADRPEETPSPPADAVLSYLDVEKRNVTNAEIASARFRFRVSADALDEAGATPESVTLHRYSDGEWTTLATIPAGEQNGTYRFEAISPGFSTFAIGLADSAEGSDDGSAADSAETTTRTEGNENGEGTSTTADSEDAENSEDAKNADSGETERDDGVDSNTFLLGVFVAALVAAALWGYLLS